MTFGPSRPRPGGSSTQHGAPPAVTDAAATTLMAEGAVADARRTSSRHLSKPAAQAHGPPQTGPDRRNSPSAASPPPYQHSMSAHIQHMPRYRRNRESQPNPKAETVRAYPRVCIRPRPHSPRTPTEQDYEESSRPATATSPHDPITPTHAHSSAQDRGPAQKQWWQRWTHTLLWELRKWVRTEPSLEGLVHRPRKESVENSRPQPAGGVDAAGRMGSHAGGCALPPGSPPPQPPRAPGPPVCPQAPAGDPPGDAARRHPPVGHHPKPNAAHTHPLGTQQAPAHRRRRHPQHPRSPVRHKTQRAWTPSQRRRHLTPFPKQPNQPPPRDATPSPARKTPNKPEAEGRQRTRQRAPLRPMTPNPSPQRSQPPNPAKAPTGIQPEPHPKTANC